jgi:hypothetical protein
VNGVIFKAGTNRGMILEIDGEEVAIELLQTMEFNADRARMSVVVKTPGTKLF